MDKLLGLMVRYRVAGGFLLALLYLWLARPTICSLLGGAVILLPGILIRAWASGHIRKGEDLATTGPYSLVRNPLYLGSFFLGLGISVMGGRVSWIVVPLYLVLFTLVYHRKMRDEETHLEKIYGERYRAFKAAVPRIVPRLRRPLPGEFSWRLVWVHKEYELWLGVAAAVAVLAARALFGR
jgi:protein-S-isoprenylcysteine O-methyltransferase Ste14